MKKIFFTLFALSLLQTNAQEFPGLDTALKRITANTDFVGATILVAKGDKIIHNKGYGYAHLDFKVPTADSTRYWVAGATNLLLGPIVMKMAEQGKFALDDKITRYLKNLPKAYEAITVKHLLTCTSGIPDYHYLGDRTNALKALSFAQDEVMNRFLDLPLTITPGSRFDWSISNFAILNQLIEATSGKSYDQLLSECISPLGISSTACFEPYKTVRNLAQGYAYNREERHYYPYSPSYFQYTPSMYVYSTTKDLFMIWRGMINGKLINRASIELMLSKEEMARNNSKPFGYLTAYRPLENNDIYALNGALAGASSSWQYIPASDATIVVLCNSTGPTTQDAERLAGQITRYILGLPPTAPRPSPIPKPIENETLTEAEMASLTGTYFLTNTLKRTDVALSYNYYKMTVRVFPEHNTLKMQELGKLPVALMKQKDGTFRRKGEPGSIITFAMQNGKASSMTIILPDGAAEQTGPRVGEGDVRSFHEGLIK